MFLFESAYATNQVASVLAERRPRRLRITPFPIWPREGPLFCALRRPPRIESGGLGETALGTICVKMTCREVNLS